MIDTFKLEAMIVMRGKTIGSFAKSIGMNPYEFERKISNECELTVHDAELIAQSLHFTPLETKVILLSSENKSG